MSDRGLILAKLPTETIARGIRSLCGLLLVDCACFVVMVYCLSIFVRFTSIILIVIYLFPKAQLRLFSCLLLFFFFQSESYESVY